MKLKLDLLGFRIFFAVRRVERVLGYSSRTQEGRFVLFADFDNVTLRALDEAVQRIGKHVSHCFVLRSSEGSFHVVSCDTRPSPGDWEHVLEEAGASMAHAKLWRRVPERAHVLRLSKKEGGRKGTPVVLGFHEFSRLPVKIKRSLRISRAHYLLLAALAQKQGFNSFERIAAFRQRYAEMFDSYDRLELVRYERPRA